MGLLGGLLVAGIFLFLGCGITFAIRCTVCSEKDWQDFYNGPLLGEPFMSVFVGMDGAILMNLVPAIKAVYSQYCVENKMNVLGKVVMAVLCTIYIILGVACSLFLVCVSPVLCLFFYSAMLVMLVFGCLAVLGYICLHNIAHFLFKHKEDRHYVHWSTFFIN